MRHLKAIHVVFAAVLAIGFSGALSAAPPKNFVQKDADPAAALLGLPWTASRAEISAKWSKAGLKNVEDSRFGFAYYGTVTIAGKPVPGVMITYMYTPDGSLKEIHIISEARAHPLWRKAGIGNFGTALVESKADGWPGSKLYYHHYWWPLKRYTVFLEYSTTYPDPTTPYGSDSQLSLEIHPMGLSQAELNSPLLQNAVPRNN